MTLSENVRLELTRWENRRRCCKSAELSGIARGAGTFHLHSRRRVGLHLTLSEPAVARRAFLLFKSLDVLAELRTYERQSLGSEGRVQLHVDDSPLALEALQEIGIVDSHLIPRPLPPSNLTGRSCCRASYLRGVFLSSGSASGPKRAHLELRVSSQTVAKHLADLACKEDVVLSVRDRDRFAIAYAKSLETVVDFFVLIGAHESALSLRESLVIAAARGDANRRANADHANLVRTSKAAYEQLVSIRHLERMGLMEGLGSELIEAAQLRLQNPSSSLRELAEMADPPVTKASMNHRLRRLQDLVGI